MQFMDRFDFNNILAKIMTNSEIVDKGHGCVFWNGARSDTGYGRIRNPFAKLNDQPAFYRTHRLVYLLNNIDENSNMILPKSDLDGHDLDVSHISVTISYV